MNDKIFVVGGHKNATLSLHHYFLSHNLKSIHGDFWIKKTDMIKNNDCFSDHFAEFVNLNDKHPIEMLVYEYPNSKFILNYRSLQGYIKSLCNHLSIGTEESDVNFSWLHPKIQVSEVIERIRNTHFSNMKIINYFKKNNLMDKLLVLKIDYTNDKRNQYLLDSFLNLNGQEFINVKHFKLDPLELEKQKLAINKHIKKYEEVCKNINISDEEYLDYLDDIYFSYSFKLINPTKS